MNKISLVCFFALLAISSASMSLESDQVPQSFAATDDTTHPATWSSGELYIFALIAFASGIIYLLFGLKYYKMIIFLYGFTGAAKLTFWIMGISQPEATKMTLILYALIAGIIGGCVLYFCYHCSIFTLGFALFAIPAYILCTYKNVGGRWPMIITVLAGLIGGIVALKVHDAIVVLSTSFSGAYSITTTLLIFIHSTNYEAHYFDAISVILIVALAIFGVVYQCKTKPVDLDNMQRDSVSSPDVYALDVNGGNPYNPYTGRKF